jgi:hypothetical protein
MVNGKELLSKGGAGDVEEAIRRATRTGEPLGSREFVAGLERRAGKRLRVLERGRPRRVLNRQRSAPVKAAFFRQSSEPRNNASVPFLGPFSRVKCVSLLQ